MAFHLQASSLGFDGQPAEKRAFPEANGDSRASTDRPDYSKLAQQRRSSVELGMGNLSHAANINPGWYITHEHLHHCLCYVGPRM